MPSYIYGIDDVGQLDTFASYTLKRVKHESEGQFDLTPSNTLVVCSTPVLIMYEKLGFTILPAELDLDRRNFKKKIMSLGILEELNETLQRGSGRPARLYRFNRKKYFELKEKGYNFDIFF